MKDLEKIKNEMWEEHSSHFPKVYMNRIAEEQRKSDFMAGIDLYVKKMEEWRDAGINHCNKELSGFYLGDCIDEEHY